MDSQLVTIERHILQQQLAHPEATGVFTNLLYDIALSAKIVANQIHRAGLIDILGKSGQVNVQGEQQKKLDVFADETFVRMNSFTGRVGVMGSEEREAPIILPEMREGKYVLLFDPLDGSSNISVNVSVGTVFGIYHRKSAVGTPGSIADCLQPGRDLVGAGYIIYGSSTMMVYTTGNGVHGFTLEPSLGEFLLSHPDLRIPSEKRYYSVNLSYEPFWSEGIRRYTHYLQGLGEEDALSARYVGSMVVDVHRNLLKGGVFYYPLLYREPDHPRAKLRLLYEAAPMAFIVEEAGGYASNGVQNVLDIEPQDLHERVPLFIGNRDLVEKAEEYVGLYG
jgi:fructose-1,6-bisphosphatase I